MARRRRGAGWGPGTAESRFYKPPTKNAQLPGAGWGPGTAQPRFYQPVPQPGVSNTGPGGSWEPSQPPVGGPPLDPALEAYKTSANRNIAIAKGDAAYQTGQLQQTFGYGDAGAANPYSRAALLKEQFDRAKLGTTNNMASAGQLYSGAYGRAQNENAHQYSIAEDANRRAYDQAIYGVNKGLATTTANYGVGVDDATFNSLLKALGYG